jgi:hypothetical protein
VAEEAQGTIEKSRPTTEISCLFFNTLIAI